MKNGRILKVLALGLILAMLLAPVASGKKKKKKKPQAPVPIVKVEREEVAEYKAPASIQVTDQERSSCQDAAANCITLDALSGENFVSISVTDKTGKPSPIKVTIGDSVQTFCGSTSGPLALEGNTSVNVQIQLVNLPACQAAGTTGTLTAVFSNIA